MGNERNIDGVALAGIAGRSCFYPCAWKDWDEIIEAFGNVIDDFHFVDVNYQFARPTPIKSQAWHLLPQESRLIGPAVDRLRYIYDGKRRYRELTPAWLRETYINLESDRTIRVTRRRGFGEYALDELPDGGLGVFCHRGDSAVESGSGAAFLANRKRSHPPLSNLFDKLKRKLAFPALIVSDGSNTSIRQLSEPCFVPTGEKTVDSGATEFEYFGLHWQRVGELNVDMHRPTFVWRVELPQCMEDC